MISDRSSTTPGRDYNSPNNVSGQVAFEIDQEVRKIIDECHERARQIISEHREELIRIATALIEYETLTSEQIDIVIKGGSLEEKKESEPAPAETTQAPETPAAPEVTDTPAAEEDKQ